MDMRIHFRESVVAAVNGMPIEQAIRHGDAEVERWKELFRADAEREDALRFPPGAQPAAPSEAAAKQDDRVRPGPRIRRL
jgi:hypothetical protein